MTDDVLRTIESVAGFRVGVAAAGIRRTGGNDVTLIASDRACVAAGVFTTNKVYAAPVALDKELIADHPERLRGVLINAGNANACTADEGLRNARQSAAWAAEQIGCAADEILVMSTGVIGVQLPMEKMGAAIPLAAADLRADGWHDAAHAMMTTDTVPKIARITQDGYTIAGVAKGAAMIAPNMATMLGCIVTDAQIPHAVLQRALRQAADASFNHIVVDGDMSTNDTVLALANGASGVEIGDDARRFKFTGALYRVCKVLAQAIVRDAEGATRFITLHVTGSDDLENAHRIANVIATSPLVKTAFYGGDANWGRILAAAGRSGVELDAGNLSLWYEIGEKAPKGGLQLCANGVPLNYPDAEANAIAASKEVTVTLDLGMGDVSATVWTSDLTHDYVSLNGHYRT
jgi:glutamate N-acetyltransferase / amino-acid N-acetyltransferase